jgi:hypothetical protein
MAGAGPSSQPLPKKKGHWVRNVAIALVALIVIVVAVNALSKRGGASSQQSSNAQTSQPAASQPVSSQAPASAKASAQPSVAPTAIAAIPLSGSGQATPHFTVTTGLTVLTATYSGSANFAVELLDSSGGSIDVPINVVGSYSGSVGEPLNAGTYILKIDASGPWTFVITQPRHVAGVALPHTYSMKGQQIVGPFAAGSAVAIQAQNTAGPDGGNFIVQVIDRDGTLQDIAVNEIGNYSGSTISNNLSNGPFYLNVDSDGTWTVTVSHP